MIKRHIIHPFGHQIVTYKISMLETSVQCSDTEGHTQRKKALREENSASLAWVGILHLTKPQRLSKMGDLNIPVFLGQDLNKDYFCNSNTKTNKNPEAMEAELGPVSLLLIKASLVAKDTHDLAFSSWLAYKTQGGCKQWWREN